MSFDRLPGELLNDEERQGEGGGLDGGGGYERGYEDEPGLGGAQGMDSLGAELECGYAWGTAEALAELGRLGQAWTEVSLPVPDAERQETLVFSQPHCPACASRDLRIAGSSKFDGSIRNYRAFVATCVRCGKVSSLESLAWIPQPDCNLQSHFDAANAQLAATEPPPEVYA